MAVLLLLVGSVFGEYFVQSYQGGLILAFAIWLLLSILAYFQGRNLFLAISGAHKIQKADHPRLFNIVEEMKIAAALPAMPEIYLIDDPAPNAFAVGQNPEKAAVAVTTGLLNTLNRDELQGVIAHEVGHVVNRDTLFMSMIGVMLGTVVMLAEIARRTLFFGGGRRRSRSSSGAGQAQVIILIAGLALMIVAPLIARIIYLAASRKREYLADASAAVFTRYPEGLASALEKISVSPIRMRKVNSVTAPMYIINPLQKLHDTRDSLFSTHPAAKNRIQILRSMAGGSGYLEYDQAFRRITGESKAFLPASALKQPGIKPGLRKPAVETVIPTAAPDMTRMMTGAVITGAVITDGIQEPVTPQAKARETSDAVWKSKGYRFIRCECDAILKVPPDFKRTGVQCLRCNRVHELNPVPEPT